MNNFIEETKAMISSLQDELDSVNVKKKGIEVKLAALRAYLEAENVVVVSRHTVPLAQNSFVKKATIKGKILDSALRALEGGRMLSTEQLLELFIEEGLVVGGANKLTTISSTLSRDERFQASRRFGWSLRKRESPAVNEAFNLQPTP